MYTTMMQCWLIPTKVITAPKLSLATNLPNPKIQHHFVSYLSRLKWNGGIRISVIKQFLQDSLPLLLTHRVQMEWGNTDKCGQTDLTRSVASALNSSRSLIETCDGLSFIDVTSPCVISAHVTSFDVTVSTKTL